MSVWRRYEVTKEKQVYNIYPMKIAMDSLLCLLGQICRQEGQLVAGIFEEDKICFLHAYSLRTG